MPICSRLAALVLAVLVLGKSAAPAATPVATPYGPVSLPFELHKIPDVPVYYVIGLSGVPGVDNADRPIT